MVDRSVHAAICRFVSRDLDCGEQKKPTLVKDDFLQAMHEFLPVAMRDVTKIASEGSHHGWEDVGGLIEIRNAIKEVYHFLLLHCYNFYPYNFIWLNSKWLFDYCIQGKIEKPICTSDKGARLFSNALLQSTKSRLYFFK